MMYQEKTRRHVPGRGGASAAQPVSEAAPPNSSYADLSDSPSGGLERQMQARMTSHFPDASRLSRGSGRPLTLPDQVQSSIEQHFGHSIDNLRFRESSDVESIGTKAYARGDEIHFAPGQFHPDTALGRKMIGHEVAHILQQAKGGLGNGGELNVDRSMEDRADVQGDAVASMAPAGGAETAGLSPMPTASFSSAPVQGWGVGIFNKKGEHERLTDEGRKKALGFLTRNRIGGHRAQHPLASEKSRKSLIYGARFNDVGTHSAVGMGGSLTVTKHDPFINQTHEGDMQFLHAMDTSGGDLQANVDKMKRYAQFASDVYQNRSVGGGKNFQDQNMLDYVLSQDREGDPFQEMMMSTMLTPAALKEVEQKMAKWDKKHGNESPKVRREARVRKMKKEVTFSTEDEQRVRKAAGDKYDQKGKLGRFFSRDREKYIQKKIEKERAKKEKNRSQYAQGTVGNFFTGGNQDLDAGMVALGSASHMIEDSFAGSHATRADNLYLGSGHISATDLSDDGMAVADKATPIITSPDYTKQDHNPLWGRHGKGDKFISEDASGGQLTDTNQVIDNTQGGALARDAVAQFLSMNVRMKETGSASYGGSPLESFMNRLLRPDDTALQLGATATGRAYDTKYKGPATETAQAGADAYWKATGENIVGNRKTSAETRASQLGPEIEALGKILYSGDAADQQVQAKYVPHAKEMLANVNGMMRQLQDAGLAGGNAYNQMAEHKRALQAMLVRYDQNVMNL